MERLIQVVSHMPRSSENRNLITGGLVGQLFDSLQHPPLSYVGEKFQYRDPDGRYNASSLGLDLTMHVMLIGVRLEHNLS